MVELRRRSVLESASKHRMLSIGSLALSEVCPGSILLVSGATGEALASALTMWSVATPTPERVARGDELKVLWQGPSQWLAVSDGRGGEGLRIAGLRERLAATRAVVTDLSQARFVVSVRGSDAIEFLCRCCPFDVEDTNIDACFSTRLGPFTVLVHRFETDGFEIYVMRSFGLSLWETLEHEARALAA